MVSPSPGYVRVRLPAAQQPLSQLFSSGGAGGGLLLGGLWRGSIGPRMRAWERARSPPPGLLSAGKPQGYLSCQAAPLLLEHSSRSRLTVCSKLASPSKASIWGHLNRRGRPQARIHSEKHEILTATRWLSRPSTGLRRLNTPRMSAGQAAHAQTCQLDDNASAGDDGRRSGHARGGDLGQVDSAWQLGYAHCTPKPSLGPAPGS